MNRCLESSSVRQRLLPSLLGAVGIHVALLVCLSHGNAAESRPSRAVAELGVEVSLDAEVEKSEPRQTDESLRPAATVEAVRAAPLHVPAARGERQESSRADAVDSEDGVRPSEDGLQGFFGESGTQGVRSALMRGVRRASLPGEGDGGSLRSDQKARLAPGGTACADLFPYEAGVSRGEVTATLDIDASGRARLVKLERAKPTARGFEAAASVCAQRLRFEPARDSAGRTVASIALVKLVFQREG